MDDVSKESDTAEACAFIAVAVPAWSVTIAAASKATRTPILSPTSDPHYNDGLSHIEPFDISRSHESKLASSSNRPDRSPHRRTASGDEVLLQIEGRGFASDPERVGIYTASEAQDIDGDNERVEAAQAVLADAGSVFGGLQVCWRNGRRGIRVLSTGEIDRYRRLLSEVIEPDRLVVDKRR